MISDGECKQIEELDIKNELNNLRRMVFHVDVNSWRSWTLKVSSKKILCAHAGLGRSDTYAIGDKEEGSS